MTRASLLAALLEDAVRHSLKRLPKAYPAVLSKAFADPETLLPRIREELDGIRHDTPIREALAAYLAREIAPIVNGFDQEFFDTEKHERLRIAAERISAPDSAMGRLVIAFLARGSRHDLLSSLVKISRSFVPAPIVLVQSAAPLGKDLSKVEAVLAARFPFSAIAFQTVPSLGGGLRIFADGTLVDASWLGRLRTILTTIHEQTYAI